MFVELVILMPSTVKEASVPCCSTGLGDRPDLSERPKTQCPGISAPREGSVEIDGELARPGCIVYDLDLPVGGDRGGDVAELALNLAKQVPDGRSVGDCEIGRNHRAPVVGRSGNGDIVSGRVLIVSVYISDQGGGGDRGRTVRCIGGTSGNSDHIGPVSLDQAKGLQHIVLVRPTGHALDCKAIGRIRAAGRRNDGSGNAGRRTGWTVWSTGCRSGRWWRFFRLWSQFRKGSDLNFRAGPRPRWKNWRKRRFRPLRLSSF